MKRFFASMVFLIFLISGGLCFAQEGKIVYRQENKIFSLNLSGGKTEQLLGGIDALGAVFSRDNKRVAFITDIKTSEMGPQYGTLAISDIDGGNFKKISDITTEPGQFCWLDEVRLVIVENFTDAFYFNIDTGERKRINISAERIWAPSLSPDGKLIAFRTSAPDGQAIGNVVIEEVDSDKYEEIFTSSYKYGSEYFVAAVSWSPDLNMTFEVQNLQQQSNDLYLLNKETGERLKIDSGYTPYFSPDGGKIAYVSAREDINGDGEINYSDMKIYVYDVEKKTSKKITSGGGNDMIMAWSPDSHYVLYNRESSQEAGKRIDDIYFANIENLEEKNVCKGASAVAWQPREGIIAVKPIIKGGVDKRMMNFLLIGIILFVIFAILVAAVILIVALALKGKKKEIIAQVIELKAKPEDLEKLDKLSGKLSAFLVNKVLFSGEVLDFEGIKIEVVSMSPEAKGKVTSTTQINLS